MTKFKENKQYIMCVVVLTAICLFISGALALVNDITLPVITEASIARAEAARIEVLPEADGFEEITVEGKPEAVTQIFEATNGAGYVVMVTVKGYGGNIEIICGIDANGCITQTKTLSHGETAGLGAKIDTDDYKNQYIGKDASLEGVSAISGATISSTAYKNAINYAFVAYQMAIGEYDGSDPDAISSASATVEHEDNETDAVSGATESTEHETDAVSGATESTEYETDAVSGATESTEHEADAVSGATESTDAKEGE